MSSDKKAAGSSLVDSVNYINKRVRDEEFMTTFPTELLQENTQFSLPRGSVGTESLGNIDAIRSDQSLVIYPGATNNFYVHPDTNFSGAVTVNGSPVVTRASHAVELRGPAAQRPGTASQYWQVWMDTDGLEQRWLGDRTGGWRLYSGTLTNPAAAWQSAVSPMWGRTINFTVPTILDPTETLLITSIGVGTGFGTIGGVAITRNATDTTAVVRFMQINNATIQSLTIAWQIMKM